MNKINNAIDSTRPPVIKIAVKPSFKINGLCPAAFITDENTLDKANPTIAKGIVQAAAAITLRAAIADGSNLIMSIKTPNGAILPRP